MKLINNLEDIQREIASNSMVLAYFTSTTCNMCKDLFPKIEMLVDHYPELIGVRGEVDQELLIVGTYQVLTVPTVILFVEGKETIRKSRQISIGELEQTIERYYNML